MREGRGKHLWVPGSDSRFFELAIAMETERDRMPSQCNAPRGCPGKDSSSWVRIGHRQNAQKRRAQSLALLNPRGEVTQELAGNHKLQPYF